ncbi:GAF domain-containing protein, partial [Streptomyces lonegramiae]
MLEVLCLVADTARTLLGFDFCGVLIPDAHRERLLVQGWSGLSEEYVRRVNSDRPIRLDSRSPSSRSFHQGEPVAIRDVRIEPDFALWAGVAQDQGYRAIVAVPLIAGTEVLGTLNGYYTSVHTFTRHE